VFLMEQTELYQLLLQLKIPLRLETNLLLIGGLNRLRLHHILPIQAVQCRLVLFPELLQLLQELIRAVPDILNSPVLLRLEFGDVLSPSPLPLLREELEFLGETVDNRSELLLFGGVFLDLLLVYQHHVR